MKTKHCRNLAALSILVAVLVFLIAARTVGAASLRCQQECDTRFNACIAGCLDSCEGEIDFCENPCVEDCDNEYSDCSMHAGICHWDGQYTCNILVMYTPDPRPGYEGYWIFQWFGTSCAAF